MRMEESLDDVSPEHDWKAEAEAVVRDVRDLVNDISVSSKLHSNNKVIYLNLTTIECQNYTVELSALGFRVVSEYHDSLSSIDSFDQRYYDTPFALLSTLSHLYQERLTTSLAQKLTALSKSK